MSQPDCTCPLCGSTIGALPLTLLPERGMVVANGKFVTMPTSEMRLLEILAESWPRIVSKEKLLAELYSLKHEDEEAQIKIIDVFVCKIRKKIAPIGLRIDTAWGRGYALGGMVKPQIVSEAA